MPKKPGSHDASESRSRPDNTAKKTKPVNGKTDIHKDPASAKESGLVDLPVASLTPHPLQAQIYGPRADWQIEELAESMRKGQDEPVEVLPDRTIISGHGRVAAAKRLGWETIRCRIRHDLAAAGPQAVEARLIEANLYRRQLSKLDMVRSYRHIRRLLRTRYGALAEKNEVKGDLRDLIAQRFGVSGRTLDRWLQVLELPLPIQQAVDDGRLPMTQAVKVATLERKVQTQIAGRIDSGESPRDIINEYARPAGKPARTLDEHLGQFLCSLERALAELGDKVPQIKTGIFSDKAVEVLRGGRKLIDELTRQIQHNKKRQSTMVSDVRGSLDTVSGPVRP
jgi:ParB-like chromosome segregation protein Spo0J